MKKRLLTACLAAGLIAATAHAQEPPFGSDADKAYANLVWEVMVAQGLAGDNAILTQPYDGAPPHGMMLETFYSKATIDGHTGDLIVKRNYAPEGVTKDEIMADPSNHLGAVTVMYRREAGFDPDDGDWFWVKFLPDGTLDKNADGRALAGMVAKGADQGCIACHSGAGDFVFTTDHLN